MNFPAAIGLELKGPLSRSCQRRLPVVFSPQVRMPASFSANTRPPKAIGLGVPGRNWLERQTSVGGLPSEDSLRASRPLEGTKRKSPSTAQEGTTEADSLNSHTVCPEAGSMAVIPEAACRTTRLREPARKTSGDVQFSLAGRVTFHLFRPVDR